MTLIKTKYKNPETIEKIFQEFERKQSVSLYPIACACGRDRFITLDHALIDILRNDCGLDVHFDKSFCQVCDHHSRKKS